MSAHNAGAPAAARSRSRTAGSRCRILRPDPRKNSLSLSPRPTDGRSEQFELTRRGFLEIASLATASFAISGCGLAGRAEPLHPIAVGKAENDYLCRTDSNNAMRPAVSIYDDAALD